MAGNRNHWLSRAADGVRNRIATASAPWCVSESAGGKQWNMVRSGSSYCSQSDLALTFGLGADAVAAVEVQWPSGRKQRFENVAANQRVLIDESRGITALQ